MSADERVAVQEWWTGSDRRRSSSRRSPSGWASTRQTSATSTTTTCRRASSRTRRRSAAPGRDGKESICELFACPDDVPDAGELRLRRHADPRGAHEPARRGARPSRRRRVRRIRVRAVRPPRPAAARAEDGPHLPRARRRTAGRGRRSTRATVFGLSETRPWTRSSAASTSHAPAFLRRLIATGKTGRTWTTLAPDDAAAQLGEERSRIVARARVPRRSRAWSSCSRPTCASATRCSRVRAPTPRLVERLLERFARRERAETDGSRAYSRS